jgi:hypothetical protein
MKDRRKIFNLFIIMILISSTALAENPLASKKLIQALVDNVSGEIAFKYTVLISHFDRIQASEGWHDSAVMIKEELEKIGLRMDQCITTRTRLPLAGAPNRQSFGWFLQEKKSCVLTRKFL